MATDPPFATLIILQLIWESQASQIYWGLV
jgi:hypothetical protein